MLLTNRVHVNMDAENNMLLTLLLTLLVQDKKKVFLWNGMRI